MRFYLCKKGGLVKNKVVRYETQIQLVPSSMRKLNNQFALVDILLCYHGRNRNMTSISKDVIENALPSLYGIPIVGEYIYLDDGSQDFGSHGGKIILSDKGIKFEDTTKPYGFITKDAVDNAKWVTITEKDGIQQHEYLELKGCIVWQKRYEEVTKLLDKNYGQSMEIEICSGEYDSDGYYNIKELVFSAACILGSNPDGTDVIPCFESACIGRHYELDSFKKEFSLMLEEYKKINESDGSTISPTQNIKNVNTKKKGDYEMDLTKFTALLSEFKCEGTDCLKYDLLSADEKKIYVLDKEDGYKIFSVEYVMSEEDPVINWVTKAEGDITFTEKPEEEESHLTIIYNEMNNTISQKYKDEYSKMIEEKLKEYSQEFESRYEMLREEFETLKNSYSVAKDQLRKYKEIELEEARQKHIEAVKETLERFEKKIGKHPEFIYFKAKMDKFEDVDLEKLEKDLIMMSGDIMINDSNQRKSFSYNPTSTNVKKYGTENDLKDRYGHLFDGFID